jgi:hypothetical protein
LYNGYWSVTVHAKPVKGVADQHNTIWWYVNSGVAGSQPLSFTVTGTPLYSVVGGDTITLTHLDTILVTTPARLVVSSLPVASWVSAVFQTGGGPPGQPAPCNAGLAPPEIVCFPATAIGQQAVGYTALVSVKPASFNGISNPAFTGGVALQVQVPPPPTVSVSPTADTVIVGDTLVLVATASDRGVPGTPVVSWVCCTDGILNQLRASNDTVVATASGPGTSVVAAYAAIPGLSDANEIGTASAAVLVNSGLPSMTRIRRARTHLLTLRLQPRSLARSQ